MSYTKTLIEAVARDILKKPRPVYNSFLKTANLAKERDDFIKTYNFNRDTFSSDPVVSKSVLKQQEALEQQIRAFHKQYAELGASSPKTERTQKDLLNNLHQDSLQAIQNRSIDRTMKAANANPNAFKTQLDLSNNSNSALGNLYGRESGGVLGGLAGAASGYNLGRLLPKKISKNLRQGGGGLIGGLAGAAGGRFIGTRRDEAKSGYRHNDILKPYEIADRVYKG